jgi:hypothetical protein
MQLNFLPEITLVELIFDWIKNPEIIAKFDSAICSKTFRNRFLKTISRELSEVHVITDKSFSPALISWISIRKLKVRAIFMNTKYDELFSNVDLSKVTKLTLVRDDYFDTINCVILKHINSCTNLNTLEYTTYFSDVGFDEFSKINHNLLGQLEIIPIVSGICVQHVSCYCTNLTQIKLFDDRRSCDFIRQCAIKIIKKNPKLRIFMLQMLFSDWTLKFCEKIIETANSETVLELVTDFVKPFHRDIKQLFYKNTEILCFKTIFLEEREQWSGVNCDPFALHKLIREPNKSMNTIVTSNNKNDVHFPKFPPSIQTLIFENNNTFNYEYITLKIMNNRAIKRVEFINCKNICDLFMAREYLCSVGRDDIVVVVK